MRTAKKRPNPSSNEADLPAVEEKSDGQEVTDSAVTSTIVDPTAIEMPTATVTQ